MKNGPDPTPQFALAEQALATGIGRGNVRAAWLVLRRRSGRDGAAICDELKRGVAEALRLNPSSAEALWRRGSAHFKMEAWAEARSDFEAAVRINPSLERPLRALIAECRRRGG